MGAGAVPSGASEDGDLRKMTGRLRNSILLADLLWITLACGFAQSLGSAILPGASGTQEPLSIQILTLAILLVVWTVQFFNQKLEGFNRGWHFPTICSQVIVGAFYLIASLLTLGFLARVDYSRLAFSFLCLLIPAGLIVIRFIAWRFVKSWSHGGKPRRAVVIGNGRMAQELAKKIGKHPELMIEVVGFLYPSQVGSPIETSKAKKENTSVHSLGAFELLQQKRVQDLILAEHLPPSPEIEKLIASCNRAGMQVYLVPQWYQLYLHKARLLEIGDVPVISVQTRNLSAGALEAKRAFDFIGALLVLTISLPLMALIAGVLWRRKREAVKKVLRCGQDGRQFWMYCFNIDRWAENLTGFEHFFARFSLTELPELWNVVRGEMSLVGPRPESPERVGCYSVWQSQRLSVKPGLTGLAQVHGLREQHSSDEKAHFDLQYIYHWSLFFDLSLCLQTAWTLLIRLFERSRSKSNLVENPATRGRFTIREALHVDSPQSSAD